MALSDRIGVSKPLNGHFKISLYDPYGDFLRSVKSTNTQAYDRFNNLAEEEPEVSNFGYTYGEAVTALLYEVNSI